MNPFLKIDDAPAAAQDSEIMRMFGISRVGSNSTICSLSSRGSCMNGLVRWDSLVGSGVAVWDILALALAFDLPKGFARVFEHGAVILGILPGVLAGGMVTVLGCVCTNV